MSDMLDEMLEKDIDNTNNNTPPNGGGGPFGPYAFAKAVIEELRFHNFPFAKGINLKCEESYELEGREANSKYLMIIPARGNRASGRTETFCPERGNHRYASLLA